MKKPYIVIWVDRLNSGTYRIKSFDFEEEAMKMVRDAIAEDESKADNVLIVKGEIVQIGDQVDNLGAS